MEADMDKLFLLLDQTFALAEYLSLNVVLGIETSDRRCWSANDKNFQYDLISNELRIRDHDIWLKSGKTYGRRVLNKDELFNLNNDSLTVISGGCNNLNRLAEPFVVNSNNE